MRVMLWMYAVGRIPGGHQVQMEQTARHLCRVGIDAEVSFEERPDLAGYDVVHGFSLNPEQVRHARFGGRPVVLSTIYCSREFATGAHVGGRAAEWGRRAHSGLVLLRAALQGRHLEKCAALVSRLSDLRAAYEMADLLLPNSAGEAAAVARELGVTTPSACVPNAVDHRRFHDDPEADDRAPADDGSGRANRDYVLYVGRFEPHKNQLGLIEAMRGSPLRVVLAGPPHPDHAAYYERCRRRAGANVTIVPPRSHDELPALYRAARVHVLPSWFETTGLASLEAALCGCNVVTTNRGYAGEYFGGHAWYCNPADRRSVRRAVEAAYAAPYPAALRARILDRYTWDRTAEATAAAYRRVLAGGDPAAAAPAGLGRQVVEGVAPVGAASTGGACRHG